MDGRRLSDKIILEENIKTGARSTLDQAPGDGGDGEEASGANGTLQSYGTEALAKAISGQGGFGIARKIIQQVTAEDAAKGNLKSGSKV